MNKGQQAYRLRKLMYKEINEMCARYEEECGEVISHFETEEEKAQRLKQKYYEELHRQRYQLGYNKESGGNEST